MDQKFQILLTYSEGNPVEEYFITGRGISCFGALEILKGEHAALRMAYVTQIIVKEVKS